MNGSEPAPPATPDCPGPAADDGARQSGTGTGPGPEDRTAGPAGQDTTVHDGLGAVDRPTVSFELFPPRTADAAPRLWATVQALAAARPDFVSVTYGASGSTRRTTRALVRRLLRETALTPIAHLTCVGASRDEVADTVAEFLDEGVRAFLALRGDPPADQSWAPHPEGLPTAADLVRLLREIEARRCALSPAQAVRATVRPLSVAVAAFPRGNAGAGSTREQDVAALLAKQEAGADFAITQVCYDAPSYLELVDLARDAGVHIPVLPGVIPMTDPARLRRVQALTGVPVPPQVLDVLDRYDPTTESAARHRAGTRLGVDLVDALLDGGAPGVHLYTFNSAAPALDLLDGVGLGGAGAPRAHVHLADDSPSPDATDTPDALVPAPTSAGSTIDHPRTPVTTA